MRPTFLYLLTLFFLLSCSPVQQATGPDDPDNPDPLPNQPLPENCQRPSGEPAKIWNRKSPDAISAQFDQLNVSQEGTYLLLSESLDGASNTIHLIDYTSNQSIWSYSFENTIEELSLSANGCTIAAVSSKNLYLFNNNSNEPIFSRSLDDTFTIEGPIALSKDGNLIAVVGSQDKIFLFNKTSSEISILSSGEFSLEKIGISADGKFIAAGGSKATLISTETKNILWSQPILGHPFFGGIINGFDLSNNGEYLAVSTLDRLYLFSNTKKEALWINHFKEVGAEGLNVASHLSADGKYLGLLFGSGDLATFNLYETQSGELISTSPISGVAKNIRLSWDGKYIVTTTDNFDHYIELFDRDYGKENVPFHFFASQNTGPLLDDQLALSQNATTLVHGAKVGLTYRKTTPGVIASIEDTVPAYAEGSTMRLRLFKTSPAEEKKLKVTVKVMLPLMGFWADNEPTIQDNTTGESKRILAQEILNTSFSKHTLLETSLTLGKQISDDKTHQIVIPQLEIPSWLGTFFSAFEEEDGGGLAGAIFDEIFKIASEYISNNDAKNGIKLTFEELKKDNPNSIYPLFALGEVLLEDADGTLYSIDTFRFVYLIKYQF